MDRMANMYTRFTAFLALASLVVMTATSIWFMSGMSLSGHIEMTGCLFMMEESAVCSMGALDYIRAWKNTFVGVSPLLLSVTAIVVLFVRTVIGGGFSYVREKIYVKRQHSILAVDFCYMYKRSGLLRPKIY